MRWVIAVAAFCVAAGVGSAQQPTLDDVLQRMRAYLDDYASRLPAVIATETYEQRVLPSATRTTVVRRARRVLLSDYGLIRLPGEPKWQGFREVLEVDGKPVGDSRRRLAELFANRSMNTGQQARLIAKESARFNIGTFVRTINDPAVVLELLDGRHSKRVRFTEDTESEIDGVRIWMVVFTETGRPTVIQTSNHDDLPANGRAWIDPRTGQILRVVISLQLEQWFGTSCNVDVSFKYDPRMGFAVPAKMIERYYDRTRWLVSWGEATYSNYRQFTVVTEEDIGVR